MSKREADKQITQLDPRDEVYEGPPDGGKFAAAPEEVMKKRKIIKPRGSKGGAAGGGGGGIAAGAFGEGIAAGAFGGAAKPMLPTVTSEAAGAAIASVNAELAEAKEGAGAAATTPGAGAAAAVMKSAAFAGGGFGALSGGSAAGLFSGAAAAVPSWGAKKEGGAAAGGAAASGFDVMSLPPIKPAAGGFKFTAASGAGSFKAAASGFTFGIAAKPAAAAAGGGEAEGGAAGKKEGAASADGGGEGDPERATSPVFVPAVRVTKVEGHTGEEDEKIVHEQKKVVLYRFESGAEAGREGKWVERGTCTLHLNGADKADKGSRPRIVMRNESMRVVLNASLWRTMPCEQIAGKSQLRISARHFDPELAGAAAAAARASPPSAYMLKVKGGNSMENVIRLKSAIVGQKAKCPAEEGAAAAAGGGSESSKKEKKEEPAAEKKADAPDP